MPLLDADLAPNPPQGQNPGSLTIVVWMGIAALCLAIVLEFLFSPKPPTETLARVVQAVQALVKKESVKTPADQKEQDNARMFSRHRPRPPAVPAVAEPSPARQPKPAAAVRVHPITPASSPLRQADTPLGTTRARVRELLGEPDLAMSKLEQAHVVEHFVYLNQARDYATTMLLVDGRVVSVYGGMPSVVWKGGSRPESLTGVTDQQRNVRLRY